MLGGLKGNVTEATVISRIQGRLSTIESENTVCILLAVESCSRAWCFPSPDSDYDVRFIYIHPKEWYPSIEPQRDVIEPQRAGFMDLSGWQNRKALRLFARANPLLIEWLSSPIIYRDHNGLRSELPGLLPTYYEPRTFVYHHIHMADNNYREYLDGPTVRARKYLYVLRTVLAIAGLSCATASGTGHPVHSARGHIPRGRLATTPTRCWPARPFPTPTWRLRPAVGPARESPASGPQSRGDARCRARVVPTFWLFPRHIL